MSYVARDDRPADKADRYAEVEAEILAVLEGEPNLTARMATVAACYGYLGPDADPARWPADAAIDSPLQLLNLLDPA